MVAQVSNKLTRSQSTSVNYRQKCTSLNVLLGFFQIYDGGQGGKKSSESTLISLTLHQFECKDAHKLTV